MHQSQLNLLNDKRVFTERKVTERKALALKMSGVYKPNYQPLDIKTT